MANILSKWFKRSKKDRLESQAKEPETHVEDAKVEPVKEEKKKQEKSEAASDLTIEQAVATTTKTKATPVAVQTIIRPWVTEKSTEKEDSGIYTFLVKKSATKNQIKKAINELYHVTPEKINVMNMQGKRVRWGRRRGKRSDWKKASVYLKKGESITVHEGT